MIFQIIELPKSKKGISLGTVKGLFQKNATGVGQRKILKISNKKWHRRDGDSLQTVTSSPKKIKYKFLFFAYF